MGSISNIQNYLSDHFSKSLIVEKKVFRTTIYDHELKFLLLEKLVPKSEFRGLSFKKKRRLRKCENVDCVMSFFFKDQNLVYLYYLSLKFNFNLSHLIYKNFPADFGTLIDLINFLDDIKNEKVLSFFKENEHIVNVKNNNFINCNELGVIANASAGVINLYPRWRKCYENNKKNKSGYLIHEVGHSLSDLLAPGKSLSIEKEWLGLSNWKVLSLYKHQRDDSACFVSLYAKLDAYEDFAESFYLYVQDPSELLETCPEKYKYFKKIL